MIPKSLLTIIILWCSAISFAQPDTISGISLWFDASNGVQIDGSNRVTQWNDLSGNDNHAIQTDPTLQPLLAEDVSQINNMNAIKFNGLDEFLLVNLPVDFGSIFVIANYDGDTFNHYDGLFTSQAGDNDEDLIKGQSGATNFYGSGYLRSNIWVNQVQTLQFSPLRDYKVIFGTKTPKTLVSNIIGRRRNLSGTYWNGNIAELIIYDRELNADEIDSVYNYFKTKYSAPVEVGNNLIKTDFCPEVLDATGSYTSYTWSTGETTPTITVQESGKYWVDVIDIFGFPSSDTIEVSFLSLNADDTTICLGDSIEWNTNLDHEGYSFIWNNSSTDSTLFISTEQKYWVDISDTVGCAITSDTIYVTVDSFSSQISLGPDQALCAGNFIKLISGNNQITNYNWSTGSNDSLIIINTTGDYYLDVTNSRSCQASDTIHVTITGDAPSVDFLFDTICEQSSSILLDNSSVVTGSITGWEWTIPGIGTFNGQNPSVDFPIADTLPIKLEVTSSTGCGNELTKLVPIHPKPQADFTLNQQSGIAPLNVITTNTSTGAASFLWTFKDLDTSTLVNASYAFNDVTTHNIELIATSNFNCKDTSLKTVTVIPTVIDVEITDMVYQKFNDSLRIGLMIKNHGNKSIDQTSIDFTISDSINHNELLDSIINSGDSLLIFFNTGIAYGGNEELDICAEATLPLELITDSDTSNNSTCIATLSYNPELIGGISLWFDASECIQEISGNVSQWEDKSSLNNHAIQADSILQPTLIQNIEQLNGKSAVKFDGVDDILLFPNQFDAASLFAIVNYSVDTFDSYNGLLTAQSGNNSNTLLTGTANATFIHGSGYFGSGIWINNEKTRDFSSLTDFKAIFASKTVKQFPNGQIGKKLNSPNTFWNGNIAEILAFDHQLTPPEQESVYSYLRDKYAPPVDLGEDIVKVDFCNEVLDASNRFISYSWSTGDSSSSITISKSGKYWVDVIDIFGYASSDTITLDFIEIPAIDSTICLGDSIKWTINLDHVGYDFLWNNNSTDSILFLSSATQYWVNITDTLGCSMTSDTTIIVIDSFPNQLSLGADVNLCVGNTIGVITGSNIASYNWSTTSTDSVAITNTTGNYDLEAINTRGCVGHDTVLVTIIGQAPIPDFSQANTCFTDTAGFTDQSTTVDGSNIISWKWNFPGVDSSDLQNPSYHFTSIDTFDIRLEVQTDVGCQAWISKEIIINPLPSVAFINGISCHNQETQLRSQSTISTGAIINNLWKIEGNDLSGDTINYEFTSTGQKNIKLIATSDLGCIDSITQFMIVNGTPLSNFSYAPTCYSLPMSFQGQVDISQSGEVSYRWDFGDQNISFLQNPIHIYENQGEYNVTLSAERTDGLCSHDTTISVSVHYFPIADFTFDTICEGTTTTLTDKSLMVEDSIISWEWIIDGNQYSDQNPIINFPTSGSTIATLKVTSASNCENSISDTINIYPNPIADFSYSPNIGLPPLDVYTTSLSLSADSLIWNFSDAADPKFTYGINANSVFNIEGTNEIKLIAITHYGCSDSITKTINVTQPIVDIAIENVFYQTTNDFLTVGVQVINNGNTPINLIDFIMNVGYNPAFMEQSDSMLYPAESMIYVFNSSFNIQEDMADPFICIDAIVQSGIVDEINTSDNTLCEAFIEREFQILPLYPNPTEGNVNLDYFLPKNGDVYVHIYNDIGKKVYEYIFWGKEGFNQNIIPVNTFQQGVYYIHIREGKNIDIQKMVITKTK